MANIYNIRQELISIFDEIEENYGDITPELEEKLLITQESFSNKIKDYVNVIKLIERDITAIKEEKSRLNDLQKSKEKTIERLKNVIIEAVEKFGNESKTGTKFIDYGIGKVSIKNSTIVDVNEDTINQFINKYICGLSFYDMQNQLDKSIISENTLLDYANNDTDETELIPNLKLEDLNNINTEIEIKASIKDLLSTDKGFELAKSLIKYNDFKISAKADKTAIKQEAKITNYIPPFVKLENKQSLLIK